MDGLILVFLCVVNHVVGKVIYVNMGDQVTFPATENCKNGATLVHRLKDESTRPVAQCRDGWKPRPGYEDRISSNKSSVTFNSANTNDDGLYEFTYGSKDEIIQLHVVLFTDSSVTEGDTVTFPFFSVTAGKPGKFTVERDGKLVLELDFLSGVVTGAGFDERVSVSSLWESQGNLTVTLKGATAGDQGDYLLYVQDKDNNGLREDLSAVRLRVLERVLDQTTTSPPPVPPTQNVTDETQMRTLTAVGITAAVVFTITATVCFMIGWCMKTRRCMKTRSSKETPGPGVARCSDVGLGLLNADGGTHDPPEADEGPSLEGSHAESNV